MKDSWRLRLLASKVCTPVCHVVVSLEGIAPAIGPAGDSVYIPMRIAGGAVTGVGLEKRVVCGTDFAVMYADEKLVHNGNFVISDPAGDILMWYDGTSQALEGAYDEMLDGQLPRRIPCRLTLRTVSTSPEWRLYNRRPLLGVGSFDGALGTLEFVVLSVTESEPHN